MSIQSPEETINIKDLVLDELHVKETLPFDPKVDVSEKDWQDFFDYFEQGYKDFDSAPNVWKMALGMAARVTLVDPSRSSSIQFNDKHWERIYLELKKLEETKDPGYTLIEFPKVFADLRIYSPSRADQYPLDPSYMDWIKGELSQRKKSLGVFEWAAPTTIALPISASNYFSDDDIEQEIRTTKIQKDNLDKSGVNFFYNSWVKNLVTLRILFPERFNGWDLISDKLWDLGRVELDQLRQRPSERAGFLPLASNLTILAAERVIIGEGFGLKLVMPSDVNGISHEPAIPQTRKF